jgi:hypothetical protein
MTPEVSRANATPASTPYSNWIVGAVVKPELVKPEVASVVSS